MLMRITSLSTWFVLSLASASLGALACSASSGSVSPSGGGLVSDGKGGFVKPPGPGGTGKFNVGDIKPGEVQAYQCIPQRFPQGKYAGSCTGDSFQTKTADNANWAEALQKTLWFFNVQKSGPGVNCTDTQWRGDSDMGDAHLKLDPSDPNGVDLTQAFTDEHRKTLDPDGDGTVDLSGGFHDAGDYIKFGITNGYAAETLAWTLYEFPDAFSKTGLEAEMLETLRWFGDYFIRSTFVEDGKVIAFGHQVGGANDHDCGWMPPEVRRTDFCPRKGHFATDENPAADVTASAAAALALIAKVYYDRNVDISYAERCLLTAEALYEFAKKHPDSVFKTGEGLYTSEYAWDDLAFAATWLGVATGDWKYIEDAVGKLTDWKAAWNSSDNKPWVARFTGISDVSGPDAPDDGGWTESHTYCWNSVRSGAFVKLADLLSRRAAGRSPNLPEAILAEKFRRIARTDSAAWLDPAKATPAGFGWKVSYTWGSARYNSAGQFIGLLFSKYFPDDPLSAKFKSWALWQTEYLFGKNPLGKSYMMGYTDTYANQPHHAAGHASITGQPNNPAANRHIIWGALVNGPAADDSHVDDRADYGKNEVTIDYNASFVAAIAANFELTSGQLGKQCPLANFPVLEPRIDEFYTRAKISSTADCKNQVTFTLINESIHPPRYDEHLTVRYFFDATELYDKGVDPKSVQASIIYDRFPGTTMKKPQQCAVNGNMYYLEFGYEGQKFWGELVQLTAPRTTQFELGTPNGSGCVWDTTNDWSLQNLTTEEVKTPYITVYSKGELIYGEEPPCFDVKKKVVPPPLPVLN